MVRDSESMSGPFGLGAMCKDLTREMLSELQGLRRQIACARALVDEMLDESPVTDRGDLLSLRAVLGGVGETEAVSVLSARA